MTREQETAIAEAWHAWIHSGTTKRTMSTEDYLDFYHTVIRRTKALRRLHVFEVLDIVVTTEYPAPHEARRSA